MKINIIAAMSLNNVIGKSGLQPWDIPKDWEYFQSITFGHFVILGRITNKTMPKAEANNWTKIVLTSSIDSNDDFIIAKSLDEAITYCKEQNLKEVYILGGQKIFEDGLNCTDKIYLTIIDTVIEGDRFFPILDLNEWKKTKQSKKIKNIGDDLEFSFTEWERK